MLENKSPIFAINQQQHPQIQMPDHHKDRAEQKENKVSAGSGKFIFDVSVNIGRKKCWLIGMSPV